ncbi:hypothetical protein EV1_002553 [Malus domestica]
MENQGSSICFYRFLELRIASLRMKGLKTFSSWYLVHLCLSSKIFCMKGLEQQPISKEKKNQKGRGRPLGSNSSCVWIFVSLCLGFRSECITQGWLAVSLSHQKAWEVAQVPFKNLAMMTEKGMRVWNVRETKGEGGLQKIGINVERIVGQTASEIEIETERDGDRVRDGGISGICKFFPLLPQAKSFHSYELLGPLLPSQQLTYLGQ